MKKYTVKNKLKQLAIYGFCLGVGFGLLSCKEPAAVEAAAAKPLFYQPAAFPQPVYNITQFPVSEKGFELGKRLFYDGKLSRDGTFSCGSCHIQASAFSHHGHDISHGIDDKLGRRNAPAIQNVAWMKEFFWDGGVHDLDLFAIAPIENPVEMDEKLDNVLKKLRADASYRKQFKEVYGSDEISVQHFLKALSQFQLALISDNSRYDRYRQGKETFTPIETAGLQVFEAKCSSCHATDLFTDGSFRNNGLELYLRDSDFGRYNITLQAADKYKYKVPSLRNVALTGPYMHDGRFRTLEMVMKHYQKGVQDTPNLDPVLKRNGRLGIDISDTEATQLVAFLHTLSDESFIRDSRFAEVNGTTAK